jgi:hypothetical protein
VRLEVVEKSFMIYLGIIKKSRFGDEVMERVKNDCRRG